MTSININTSYRILPTHRLYVLCLRQREPFWRQLCLVYVLNINLILSLLYFCIDLWYKTNWEWHVMFEYQRMLFTKKWVLLLQPHEWFKHFRPLLITIKCLRWASQCLLLYFSFLITWLGFCLSEGIPHNFNYMENNFFKLWDVPFLRLWLCSVAC